MTITRSSLLRCWRQAVPLVGLLGGCGNVQSEVVGSVDGAPADGRGDGASAADGMVTSDAGDVDAPSPAITFHFTGEITIVTGAAPPVQIGDTFVGSFTFDPGAADEGTDGLHGNYVHRTVPYGVLVDVSAAHHVFQTNPDQVVFQIDIVNEPSYDTYGFASSSNIASTGHATTWIQWALYDTTGAAVSDSEMVPTTPPALTSFTQPFGLRIGSAAWEIGGPIATLTL